MLIFNIVGGIMMISGLALGFIVGGLVDAIWPKADKGMAAGGWVFFLVTGISDFVFRWKYFRERGQKRFFLPLTGGMFFFIPLWIPFALFLSVAFAVAGFITLYRAF